MCRVSTASAKHCRTCAAVTLAPTLALTLHTSLRRSAAADSHLLQTGAACICRSTACVDWSLSLCVSLCSVLTHPYVYVAGNMSTLSRAQAAVFGVMRRRVSWLRGSVRQQHVCVSASDAPCSPLPISPSHFSRLVL